jgi:predicted branched-subunit amino acid permease
MPTPRSEFMSGVKALLPILFGVVPFGVISGIAVVQTQIPPASGFVMSLLVFSGAALIVALQLITTGAPPLVVFFSALMINLRFMIYSASLAPFS